MNNWFAAMWKGFITLSVSLVFYILSPSPLLSQIGGLNTFNFLNLAKSARVIGLGGYAVGIADDDIAQGFINPANLNKQMEHRLSVNHNFHLAGISHGFSAYGLYLEKQNVMLLLGANYLSYGDFVRADDRGNVQGSFNGRETAITVGVSKPFMDRLSIGTHLKIINSNLDTYGAWGIGMDIGVNYSNPLKKSTFSVLVKNMGSPLSNHDIQKESLPFDLLISYTKRLEHLPFRFIVTFHDIHRWNLRFESPLNDDPIFIDQISNESSSLSKGVDNLFRHFAIGGELSLGSNEVIRIRLGYDHLRNKELAVSGFRSFSGFSFGLGIKVKKVTFDYGVGRYHLAGSANHLSLSINLQSLFKKGIE